MYTIVQQTPRIFHQYLGNLMLLIICRHKVIKKGKFYHEAK